MTSDTDDLEQQLRQNLRLRRDLGTEVAKARAAGSVKQGSGRLLGPAVGAAETASDNDDLAALRRQLKLRRELGTEVAKAKHISANPSGRIAYRLGWVVYWTCLLAAGAWAGFFLWWAWVEPGVVQDIRESLYLAGLAAASSLLLYGLGRDFRHVLSGAR